MSPLHDLPGIVIAIFGELYILRMPVADGRRDKDDLSSLQSQYSRRLREPLVPTDEDADLGNLGVEHAVSQIPRRKVEFLIIARIIGDVHLAVLAQVAAIGIQHHGRIVVQARSPLFEQPGYDDNTQFPRQLTKLAHRRAIFANRLGQAEQAIVHHLAEVTGLEQLLQAYDLGSLADCLADTGHSLGIIGFNIVATRHLDQAHIHDLLHHPSRMCFICAKCSPEAGAG